MSTLAEFDTEAGVAAQLAEQASQGIALDTDADVRAFVLRTDDGGQRVEVVTGEEHSASPWRSKAGTTTVRDIASLLLLVDRYGQSDSTVVYADPVTQKITAVLDDDINADAPRWRIRRVQVALSPTPEWTHWAGKNNQLMKQAEFAQHIEDGLGQVLVPDAADLLEVAKTLESTTRVDFRSSVRLQDGQRQFSYVETATNTAGQAGQLEVPEEFVLGLTPWHGSTGYRVKARLRFRVGDTGLHLGYRLDQVERVLLDAFAALLEPVTAAGLPLVSGTP